MVFRLLKVLSLQLKNASPHLSWNQQQLKRLLKLTNTLVCLQQINVLINLIFTYFYLKLGCAVSGLMADSRTMVDRARVEAQNHWFTYDEKMSVESVAQSVSNLAIQFGDSDDDGNAMSRYYN